MHIVENNRAVKGAFSIIGIAYIYAPKTSQGNSAALVIIDYLTVWIHAELVSIQNVSSTCLVLFRYICQYGCPQQIIQDNVTHFTAQEMQQYMKNTFDIRLNFGPSPQTAKTRKDRTHKPNLEVYIEEKRLEIRDRLGYALAVCSFRHEDCAQNWWSIFTFCIDLWPTSSVLRLGE